MLIRREGMYFITIVLAAMCVIECGLTVICLRNLILLCLLVYLSVMDLNCYQIPDKCLVAAVLVWFAAIPLAFEVYGGVSGIVISVMSAVGFGGGMLLFTLLMDYFMKKETMGGGDIKLFAVSGLYLGIVGALIAMFLACILGMIFALLHKNKNKFSLFPRQLKINYMIHFQ